MAFELTHQQGAALITKQPTYREDIEREATFENYIKQHYDSWIEFARENDHDENIRPILVTGVDLTQEFATVAYSDNQPYAECGFSAATPGVAFAPVWGWWQTQGLVHTNCGPSHARKNRSSSESSALGSEIPREYTQCVFIRYYTIRKRTFFPTVLKAGAGLHQLPKGEHEDDSSDEEEPQVSSFDSSTEAGSPETGSPGEVFYEVIHNVPAVGQKKIDHTSRYSRNGSRMTAIASMLSQNSYFRSDPLSRNGRREFTHFNRNLTQHPCYYITMTFKTFSR